MSYQQLINSSDSDSDFDDFDDYEEYDNFSCKLYRAPEKLEFCSKSDDLTGQEIKERNDRRANYNVIKKEINGLHNETNRRLAQLRVTIPQSDNITEWIVNSSSEIRLILDKLEDCMEKYECDTYKEYKKAIKRGTVKNFRKENGF